MWIKTTKIGCHGNITCGIKELTSGKSSRAIVLKPLKLGVVKIGPVDYEITGLTRILKK